MSDSNASSARMLMKGGGYTFSVVGFALSSVATLYMMDYLTAAGTSTIEYMPHLYSATSNVTFAAHMASSTSADWLSVFKTVGVLLSGVVVRKLGTFFSSDGTISTMEKFLYRTSNSKAHDSDVEDDD